ncbi:16S rRNA (cytosine(967)-C(5))-methyltransferase RsmB [Fangia hongkongensis]|uniref:16S rRNA (cytosine(967)-C(5))-methyltransferase RsmB n=1 Tax=Fangia hongkongensis TaxID=270495 RepID=UPI00036C2682|nr:16S rRNA (cytosine(967)-C(5))-methyltransferase RsmB [Fangia hongkongensis]MBK2124058.1 16S rRNA (cytosine(967)-C(5))-methyltransferase RsmB [Fangia hongkongensis]
MSSLTNPRAIACTIIHDILQNKDSLIHLDKRLNAYQLSEQNRKLVYLITYGVFRHYFYLTTLLHSMLEKKTKAKVKTMLLVGLYQLIFMKKAKESSYAIVDETLKGLDQLQLSQAKGFINALLRKIDKNKLTQYTPDTDAPDWLIGKLNKYYGAQKAKEIIRESNLQASTFLRLNERHNIKESLQLLSAENVTYKETTLPNCIELIGNYNIAQLAGFPEGRFSVQDFSAQFAAHILDPKADECILDACAAPGGKSTHLLEKCKEISLYIMDNNEKRFSRIYENIARLQQSDLNIHYLCQDASLPLDNTPQFDKILLDAPCSATGVIRRHPDIKVLREADEVKEITKIQAKILRNLWLYLKPNGQLLYATCSILPEENEKQIHAFLSETADAKHEDIAALSQQTKLQYGYQLLPQSHKGDGFYYCLLRKSLIA